jgi:hypothetical protein
VDRSQGVFDDGIQPLAAFVDTAGPDAVAVSVEVDAKGEIHPGVYVRRDGQTSEHVLAGDPLLNFERDRHRAELENVLKGLVGGG